MAMAHKSIRKLMLVIMELLILILLKVQENDHAYITFQPSSPPTRLLRFPKLDTVQINDLAPNSFSLSRLPILYPHSSELDKVQETMHTYFADKIK